MWDDDEDDAPPAGLSHEMPCPRCGHPPHLFLRCHDSCDCDPDGMPGDRLTG